MRRALFALVLALFLVTAGCNSLFSPEPSSAPKTTTPLSGQLAPGLSADGFTDREKLTAAHDRILREGSYTLRVRVTETGSNGSVLGHVRTVQEVGSNNSHFTYHITQNGSLNAIRTPSFELSAWTNGTTTLFARTRGNHTSYQWTRAPDSLEYVRQTTSRDRLYILFTAFNATNVKRTEQTGTPMYRVVADNVSNPSVLPDFDSIRNASLVASIDTWGVVHRYRFEATGMKDGETVHRTESFDVTKTGTTKIHRPKWYSAAMNATSRRNRSAD